MNILLTSNYSLYDRQVSPFFPVSLRGIPVEQRDDSDYVNYRKAWGELMAIFQKYGKHKLQARSLIEQYFSFPNILIFMS